MNVFNWCYVSQCVQWLRVLGVSVLVCGCDGFVTWGENYPAAPVYLLDKNELV